MKVCRCLPSRRSPGSDPLLGELIDALVRLPPTAVYAVIGALAAIENVFPPVPADTAVAIGAILSTGGPISAWTVFLVTWVANVGMAAVVYMMARTAGRAFFRGPLGSRLLRPPALQRLELLYGRYGTWAIFFSRFIPGVRAVVPPFAGVANLGAVRTLVPLTVASGLWYGGLTLVAVIAVRNLSQLGAFLTHLNTAAVVAVGVVAAAMGVVVLVRRRRRAGGP